MLQFSQLGFWMFSGALGAAGIAASVGVLDQPPRQPLIAKTSLVGEQVSGGNTAKKPGNKKLAKLSSKPETAAKKPAIVTPKAVVPTFGLLRVEEDGSTLIAGNAEPNSKIEIFDGVVIVATTTAASNGDFAALLDKPLSPGEHQLGIRATGKDNDIQVSAETGLVSMPEKKDGQLLAMVMKPGEASRVIQKPETAKPVEVTKKVPEKTKPIDVAKVAAKMPEPETKKATIAKKPQPEKAKPIVVAKAAAKVVAKKPEPEIIKAAIAKKPPEKMPEIVPKKMIQPEKVEVVKVTPKMAEPKSAVVAKAEMPSAEKTPQEVIAKAPVEKVMKATIEKIVKTSVEKIDTAPKVMAEKSVKEDILIASKPGEEKLPAPIKEAISVEPQKLVVKKAPENPKPAEKTPVIIVEAVEIDGPSMFIAGAAEPGRRVAIYVDNKLVGFADGSREGRFLLEVERALTRGQHVVRADIYDAKGDIVTARAEVPLIHEPEELAAVVAKAEPAPKPPKTVPAVKKEEPKVAAKPVTETKVVAVKKPKIVPKELELVAVAPAKEIVAPAKAVEQVAKVVIDKQPDMKAVIKKNQPAKLKKLEEVAIASPKKPIVETPKKVLAPAKPVDVKVAAEKPVEVMKPAATKTEVKIAETTAAPVKKVARAKTPIIAEPKVQQEVKVASAAPKAAPPRRVLRTGSSVIIRRGDSLWRISYRTYGRGIRYSTIYKANLSQLRSPHKIYPGQILKVPKNKFKQQG